MTGLKFHMPVWTSSWTDNGEFVQMFIIQISSNVIRADLWLDLTDWKDLGLDFDFPGSTHEPFLDRPICYWHCTSVAHNIWTGYKRK